MVDIFYDCHWCPLHFLTTQTSACFCYWIQLYYTANHLPLYCSEITDILVDKWFQLLEIVAQENTMVRSKCVSEIYSLVNVLHQFLYGDFKREQLFAACYCSNLIFGINSVKYTLRFYGETFSSMSYTSPGFHISHAG